MLGKARCLLLGAVVILVLGSPQIALPQEEESKGLKPDVPGASMTPYQAGIRRSPKHRRPIRVRPRKAFSRVSAPPGTEFAQLGVTIFRVNRGQGKGLEQVGEEQTIERLDTNSSYKNGDTIRLRIES